MGRKAAWKPVVDERGLSKLRPMYGPRPLDTYTSKVVHERDARGKPTGAGRVVAVAGDCPCRGTIPFGSQLVCEVCGRSGLDDRLDYLLKLKKQRDRYAEKRAQEDGGRDQDNGSDEPSGP